MSTADSVGAAIVLLTMSSSYTDGKDIMGVEREEARKDGDEYSIQYD